jgi:uncharacterized protein (TIGR02118 family)
MTLWYFPRMQRECGCSAHSRFRGNRGQSKMVSYFVRYCGSSRDLEAFQSHYETRHAAILKSFPNIRSLVLHRPAAWTDPFSVRRGESLLLAQMKFDGPADLDAALQSEARKAARDDFHRFPPFEGEVTHEDMSGKVIF